MGGLAAQLKALGSANVWMLLDLALLIPAFVAATFYARNDARWRHLVARWKLTFERGIFASPLSPLVALLATLAICVAASGFSWPLPKIHEL